MGMPAAEPPVLTIEELLALPDDGRRHELLDGIHVVTPSPALRHQRAVRHFLRQLERLLGDRENLELLTSPADVRFGATTLVQPDMFGVRQDPSKPSQQWTDLAVPVLVIEILSPGTAAWDRGQKREIYQRAGVLSYWIVDVDARLVEQWSPGDQRPEIIRESLEWRVGDESVGKIDLPLLFARIVR